MTTFQDIFKKTFIQNFQSISLIQALVTMLLAILFGFIIYYTYRKTFSGVIYSKNFNISLMGACIITSVIVITISSNIALSLGMVGALSIVRFRTAVKEAIDVVYMFWAITVGIVCGAGLYLFAALSTVIVSGFFIIMDKIKHQYNKYILVINYNKRAFDEIDKILQNTKYILRTKTITANDVELVIELDMTKDETIFINSISDIKDVKNVSLVNYKSDI